MVDTQDTPAASPVAHSRPPLFRNRSKRFWIVVVVVAALFVFYLPSLVAYRYTASSQNTGFLIHPWRSWSFISTALTVPGDSQLKTSGSALRAADALFHGSAVDPQEVRLLFLPEGKPYTFTHMVGRRTVTTTVTPPYRFVWQVTGHIDTAGGPGRTIVGLLDYKSGKALYDVRSDLTPVQNTTEPSDSASPSPTASP
jgi:hypothetical protein